MRIWDTFLFRGGDDELAMLECRLTELDATDIYRHVLVEATIDHQGRPKPLHYAENKERFAPWSDRIVYVVADNLPSGQGPWPRINAQREAVWQGLHGIAAKREYGTPEYWHREHAQREYVAEGLAETEPDDIIMHGDLDEIISPAGVEIARHPGMGIRFEQRCTVFAVDWELPWGWKGTVAAYAGVVRTFTQLRDAVFPVTEEGGGWHLSWIGGNDAIRAKMESYCHNEMDEYIKRGLAEQQFYERGIFWGHGQGDTQLLAVDVDETWPQWVYGRKCPESWFRPRKEES
jgi:hypothetical protein